EGEDVGPGLGVAGAHLAVLKDLALAARDDLSLNGFFGRRIGNHDAARRGAILFEALHDHTVMERTNLHGSTLLWSSGYSSTVAQVWRDGSSWSLLASAIGPPAHRRRRASERKG